MLIPLGIYICVLIYEDIRYEVNFEIEMLVWFQGFFPFRKLSADKN